MDRSLFLSVGLVLLISPLAFGQIRPDTLSLWPMAAPGALGSSPQDIPTLTVYLPVAETSSGTAVLVCPGGGYGHLAMDHEGKQVAEWLNANGMAAFVLKYRIAPRYHHPAPLLDVQRALRIIRFRAEEWGIDANRIGIIGFSAGGHLASSAGTHFTPGIADAPDPIDQISCRPDFMILCYPVISMKMTVTHQGTRRNLIGSRPDTALVTLMSNEEQITDRTPPTFLFHTTNDQAVAVENSLLFYRNLVRAGVGAEMHIFRDGPHGVGLAHQYAHLQSWPKLCLQWLRGLGML